MPIGNIIGTGYGMAGAKFDVLAEALNGIASVYRQHTLANLFADSLSFATVSSSTMCESEAVEDFSEEDADNAELDKFLESLRVAAG